MTNEMTAEEAIERNKNLRMYMELSDKTQRNKFLEENYIALDMSIKALEQGDVLDKIRAKIEQKIIKRPFKGCERWHNDAILEVLDIIDKYRKGDVE